MTFQLLCGPANAGKVARVLDAVRSAAAAGHGAWLVVPTDIAATAVRRELAETHGTVLDVTVGTFHALVRELAGDEVQRGADRSLERFALRRLLERSRDFAGPARYSGFVDLAHQHVTALRSADVVGGEAVRQAVSRLPGSERSWRRLADEWGSELADLGVVDDAWFEAAALARFNGEGAAWTTPIHVYGFDDLSAFQTELLCVAARDVDVVVAMSFVPGRVVFERRNAFVARCQEAGAVVTEAGPASAGTELLAHLERSWSEPTVDAIAAPTPTAAGELAEISAVECCGDLQEAEEVVREVGRLLAASVDAREIAVLGANPSGMRPLLEFTARRAGIDLHFELSRAIGETPAGRALLQLFAAVHDNDALRFSEFLRSHLVDAPSELVDRYEHALRSVAVSLPHDRPPGWFVDTHVVPERWHKVMARIVPEDVATFVRSATRTPDRPHVDELVAACGALRPADEGDVRLIASVIASMQSIVAATSSRRPPSIAELADVVGAARIPAIRRSEHPGVLVAPITAVRTDRFDAVVVFSLANDAFRVSVDDPDDSPVVARELAYTACTRPRRILRVMRQVATSEGSTLAPHPAWLEIMRLVRDIPVTRRGLRDVVPAADAIVFPHEVDDVIAVATGEGRVLAGVDAAAVERVRACTTPTVRTDETIVPAVAAHVRARGSVPATQIEQYAKCSTQWLIARVIRPLDDPDDELEHLVRGNLAHHVLEHIVTAENFTREGPVPGLDLHARISELLADAARIERVEKAHTVRDIDLAIVEHDLREFLAEERMLGDATLPEVHIEPEPEEPDPDVTRIPPLMVRDIAVTGRVDRIDVGDDGTVVLHDYKFSTSSNKGWEAKKLVSTASLQLLIYWLAIDRSPLGWSPAAALYRSLRGTRRPRGLIRQEAIDAPVGSFRPDMLDDEHADEVLEGALARTEEVIDGMLAGRVTLADPADRTRVCTYCAFTNICRVSEAEA